MVESDIVIVCRDDIGVMCQNFGVVICCDFLIVVIGVVYGIMQIVDGLYDLFDCQFSGGLFSVVYEKLCVNGIGVVGFDGQDVCCVFEVVVWFVVYQQMCCIFVCCYVYVFKYEGVMQEKQWVGIRVEVGDGFI